MPEPPQRELFPPETAPPDAVGINARCRLQTREGHRAVLVAGVPIAHYAVGDAMAEAYAMVQLVTQGWADQNEVARAFGRSERSVRRYQRRFEGGGLAALGRPGGYPAGRPRLDRSRDRRVNELRAQGKSHRQIADHRRRFGEGDPQATPPVGLAGAEPAQIELPTSGPAATSNLSRTGTGPGRAD